MEYMYIDPIHRCLFATDVRRLSRNEAEDVTRHIERKLTELELKQLSFDLTINREKQLLQYQFDNQRKKVKRQFRDLVNKEIESYTEEHKRRMEQVVNNCINKYENDEGMVVLKNELGKRVDDTLKNYKGKFDKRFDELYDTRLKPLIKHNKMIERQNKVLWKGIIIGGIAVVGDILFRLSCL